MLRRATFYFFRSAVDSERPGTSLDNIVDMEDIMSGNDRVKGPASYFPSIEKKYGQPVDHWLGLIKARREMKHMELVSWLKAEHGLGHGHANALVAYHLAGN
jgi:hypothetical protein